MLRIRQPKMSSNPLRRRLKYAYFYAMHYTFREASLGEVDAIWQILEQAIRRRRADGSRQWQDGYPNRDVVCDDIKKGVGYVLAVGTDVAGYCAVLQNDEPAYARIEGAWLTEGDFLVVHRVAISDSYIGQGLAKKMLSAVEGLARDRNINSIKADTSFDNPAMMHVFEALGYHYCGDVMMRGAPRRAYEKVLV
ncbi:MAG TPA: GNAT family N-acetyltransferase [Sphingobacterium sp.]|nr:GNAT family N-acetyltransferase [Sphingobacterium sp.]